MTFFTSVFKSTSSFSALLFDSVAVSRFFFFSTMAFSATAFVSVILVRRSVNFFC